MELTISKVFSTIATSVDFSLLSFVFVIPSHFHFHFISFHYPFQTSNQYPSIHSFNSIIHSPSPTSSLLRFSNKYLSFSLLSLTPSSPKQSPRQRDSGSDLWSLALPPYSESRSFSRRRLPQTIPLLLPQQNPNTKREIKKIGIRIRRIR